jgi:formate-dependent nitrite reductase membrane component NrfD
MNLFVESPQWGWWIVLYFFLGGIASGAYFTANLIDLVGGEDDRRVARFGFWIAFPLVVLCSLFLIVDLERPERFWHMLFKSEVVEEALRLGWPTTADSWRRLADAPLLKYWSPISLGSWALLIFGACSFLSLLGSLWPGGRLERLLGRGIVGRSLQVIGSLAGFFIASYTGTLLTASNQPLWSDSFGIAALFLASSASTGIAALILLAVVRGRVPEGPMHRLELADLWVLALELVVFVLVLASLGPLVERLRDTWNGKLLIGGTFVLALIVPFLAALLPRAWPNLLGLTRRRGVVLGAFSALLGGFVFRYAILNTPPELLTYRNQARSWPAPAEARTPENPLGVFTRFSPEDGRRFPAPGADPDNRATDREDFQPASKVFKANAHEE